MNRNKLILNIIFQISIISVISGFFIYDKLDYGKLGFLFTSEIVFIFVLLFLLKLFIATLFLSINNLISGNKGNSISIISTFLQGGIVNMLIPGSGLIFKYYKFKITSGISVAEYSVSQSILSLFSLSCYFILGLILGLLKFYLILSFNSVMLIFLFIGFIILLFFTKDKLTEILKKNLRKFKRIENIYKELSSIKNILKNNKYYFLLIFLVFFLLSLCQCYVFYKALNTFGYELDFVSCSFIFISATIATILLVINFIGFFEILIVASAAYIVPNLSDIFVFGISYRVINTTALISAALVMSAIGLTLKKMS